MPLDSQRSRKNRRADTLSDDTGFSGLPKIIRVSISANQGPLPAAWQPISMDKLVYNYGPFTRQPVGAGYWEIVVQESGFYHAVAQFLLNNVGGAGHSVLSYISVNSGGGAGTGFLPGYPRQDSDAQNAGNPSRTWGGYLELKAGDSVGMQIFSTAAVTTLTDYTNLWLKKEGGQY